MNLQRHQMDDVFKARVLSHLEALSSVGVVGCFSDNGPPPHSVVYPVMISAENEAGDVCSLSHGSSCGSLGASGSSSGSNLDGPLECPFCGARHRNEKSHVQHMTRLLRRLGALCLYIDVCVSHTAAGWAVFMVANALFLRTIGLCCTRICRAKLFCWINWPSLLLVIPPVWRRQTKKVSTLSGLLVCSAL